MLYAWRESERLLLLGFLLLSFRFAAVGQVADAEVRMDRWIMVAYEGKCAQG